MYQRLPRESEPTIPRIMEAPLFSQMLRDLHGHDAIHSSRTIDELFISPILHNHLLVTLTASRTAQSSRVLVAWPYLVNEAISSSSHFRAPPVLNINRKITSNFAFGFFDLMAFNSMRYEEKIKFKWGFCNRALIKTEC